MYLALPAANYQPSDYLPIVIQFGLALAFVAFAMIVSHLVGPKRHSAVKDASFECGIESAAAGGFLLHHQKGHSAVE